MSNFEEKYFNDFIKLNRGFDLPNQKIKEGNYPVVASTGIKDYHDAYKVKGPGVVTGRSGSLGVVQYVNVDYWPLNTSLYVKDFKGNDPKFVYYFLQTMHLENFNSGAGVPSLNQNHLHKQKILVPSFSHQQRIASILSAYDELIEVNNERIKLLEETARELYKEWFVRMRFPGYKKVKFVKGVPQGWTIDKVKNIVDRRKFGRTYKIEELSEQGEVIVIDQSTEAMLGYHNNSPDHIATSDKPIIIFGDHTCKMQLMIQPFSLAENVIPVSSKNNMPIYYLYYLIESLVETTEYKRHWNDLVTKSVFIVDPKLQKKYSEIVKPFFEQIEILKKYNIQLRQIRDRLLPRLISGKLEVKESKK
jgi:type I restriction enzyme S subunit